MDYQQLVDSKWNEYSFKPLDNKWKNKYKRLEFICNKGHVFEGILRNYIRHDTNIPCPTCRLEKRKEDFLSRLNIIHGKNISVDLSKFNTLNSKVDCTCNVCKFNWNTKPIYLVTKNKPSRCPECSRKKVIESMTYSKEEFIKRNPDLQESGEYEIIGEYINTKIKTTFLHKTCGNIYEVKPETFQRGCRCSKCSNKLSVYKRSDWVRKGQQSNYFDSFKVYIILCWNESEQFIKIGRTFQKVNNRFSGKKVIPYNYTVIKTIENDSGEYIFDLENKLHKKFKAFKYQPNISFAGENECFNTFLLNYIKT